MTTCIDTVVIGAGHAGLAVSWFLTRAGRDHVLLDRGRVAERWRSERWDSLHLLTPSWMTRLPGWCYAGPDPDGYLSAASLVRHLEQYAASFGAPVAAARDGAGGGRHPGAWSCEVPRRHRRWNLACPPRRSRHRSTRQAARAGWPGRPLPAHRGGDLGRLPQPRQPRAGWRARGWRVRLRRTDRRRTDRRRARRDPRRRAAHPDAAPLPWLGHLLVAGGHRSPRPYDRRRARPRRGPTGDLATAGWPGPGGTRPRPRSAVAARARRTAAGPARRCRGHGRIVCRRPGRSGRRGRSENAPLPRRRRLLRRAGRARPRGAARRPAAPAGRGRAR